MIDSIYVSKNQQDIINKIYSNEFDWLGTSNGDTVTKYQGRKLKQLALVMLLIGDEMEQEKKILPEETRKDLFFDFVRRMGDRINGNHSGTSQLDFGLAANLWKMIEH